MRRLNVSSLNEVIRKGMKKLYDSEVAVLKDLKLAHLLRKRNWYLPASHNEGIAGKLIRELIDVSMLSSEEKLFGDFLEELAIFVCSRTFGGYKSSATGIDLEFRNKSIHYIVSVKSGPNWGNSNQQKKQEQDFQAAIKVLKQSRHTANVQPVLGICYGKTRTTHLHGYMKIMGQNFWYLISGNKNLYTDIIEPIEYRVWEQNEDFLKTKSIMVNLFTKKFIDKFCDNGAINWKKLVAFNSGNFNPKDADITSRWS